MPKLFYSSLEERVGGDQEALRRSCSTAVIRSTHYDSVNQQLFLDTTATTRLTLLYIPLYLEW